MTYIRCDLELFVQASLVGRFGIFAEQILVEHGLNLVVGVAVGAPAQFLATAAELREYLKSGAF